MLLRATKGHGNLIEYVIDMRRIFLAPHNDSLLWIAALRSQRWIAVLRSQ